LLVTCIVDLFRPSVGFAAVRLLEAAGCTVAVPGDQTCCGQPAYTGGDRRAAQALARRTIALFEGFDHVVAPSGSCAAVLGRHYPALLADDPAWAGRAAALAPRVWELTAYLVTVCGLDRLEARFDGAATYHDCCSGLRELGVKAEPRALLGRVDGLSLTEMAEAEICCGFGGAFCVKYPPVAEAMAAAKAAAIAATGAGTLLAGDLGCLLHLAGTLSRAQSPVRVRHVAEVLAGTADGPAIGEPAAQ